jgi:hypothetical protein
MKEEVDARVDVPSAEEIAEYQNAYYNGWLHDHFAGCVFVTLGVVVACALNAPGSWHDCKIAVNCKLYDKLQSVYDSTGGIAVVNAAFQRNVVPL